MANKTGELKHQYFDSALWNDFPFRDDDIVVGTYAKIWDDLGSAN